MYLSSSISCRVFHSTADRSGLVENRAEGERLTAKLHFGLNVCGRTKMNRISQTERGREEPSKNGRNQFVDEVKRARREEKAFQERERELFSSQRSRKGKLLEGLFHSRVRDRLTKWSSPGSKALTFSLHEHSSPRSETLLVSSARRRSM